MNLDTDKCERCEEADFDFYLILTNKNNEVIDRQQICHACSVGAEMQPGAKTQ